MIKRLNQGELKNNEGILYTWLMDAKMPTFSILTCRFASKVWKKRRSFKYTVYFLDGRRKSLVLACSGTASASKGEEYKKKCRYTVCLDIGRRNTGKSAIEQMEFASK